MTPKLVLIAHDTDSRDDRASAWAAARGFALDWRVPAEGDGLPPIEDAAGVIIYGGKQDVSQKHELTCLLDELRYVEAALKRETPVLGLCLGGQLLAHALGQHVGRNPSGAVEYGYYDLVPTKAGAELFGSGLKVLESHWEGWFETPAGAVALGSTEHFSQQAFRYGANAYGFQFHPEATLGALTRWVGRRAPARHAMPGAHAPERQLADNLIHDAPLGGWFHGFLDSWIGAQAPIAQTSIGQTSMMAAAE